MADQFREIYRIVARIPSGAVASYSDVAVLCRTVVSARTVGWAMATCPEGLPWHRVVSQQGRLSIGRRSGMLQDLQRSLLQSEGVRFLSSDRVDIENHRWQPRKRNTRPG